MRDAEELSVADNGPGIAPEHHERIQGTFQTPEARETGEGTGIGLSVVQKVAETRGGRAGVESAPGADPPARTLRRGPSGADPRGRSPRSGGR